MPQAKAPCTWRIGKIQSPRASVAAAPGSNEDTISAAAGSGAKAPSHLAGLGLENAWWPMPYIHPTASFHVPL